MNDSTVLDGGESILSVTADASPVPTIEWFRNDTKIKTDKRIVSKSDNKVFTLTITGTKPTDQGNYKAVIKNKCGSVETRVAVLSVSVGPSVKMTYMRLVLKIINIFYKSKAQMKLTMAYTKLFSRTISAKLKPKPT